MLFLTRLFRRGSRFCLLALLMSLAAGTFNPGPARAGQFVFERGGAIWVAADDGTNARALINVADVPGMHRLTNPYVSADGRVIVFEGQWAAATAEWMRWSTPGALGMNADAVLRYADGRVTRLTSDWARCPLAPCYTGITEPELRGGLDRRRIDHRFVGARLADVGAERAEERRGGDAADRRQRLQHQAGLHRARCRLADREPGAAVGDRLRRLQRDLRFTELAGADRNRRRDAPRDLCRRRDAAGPVLLGRWVSAR